MLDLLRTLTATALVMGACCVWPLVSATPHERLWFAAVIRRAAQLAGCQLKEIAFSCGYGSEGEFSRMLSGAGRFEAGLLKRAPLAFLKALPQAFAEVNGTPILVLTEVRPEALNAGLVLSRQQERSVA